MCGRWGGIRLGKSTGYEVLLKGTYDCASRCGLVCNCTAGVCSAGDASVRLMDEEQDEENASKMVLK